MTTMSTLFDGVELSPPVEVYALNAAFNDDTDSHKVNLSIGGRPNYGFVNFAAFAVSMTLNLAQSSIQGHTFRWQSKACVRLYIVAYM